MCELQCGSAVHGSVTALHEKELSEDTVEQCVVHGDGDIVHMEYDSQDDSSMFVEDDEKPAWTYLSEELGIDCSMMKLSDFLAYVKHHPGVIDTDTLQDIMQSAREDIVESREQGFVLKYAELYE